MTLTRLAPKAIPSFICIYISTIPQNKVKLFTRNFFLYLLNVRFTRRVPNAIPKYPNPNSSYWKECVFLCLVTVTLIRMATQAIMHPLYQNMSYLHKKLHQNVSFLTEVIKTALSLVLWTVKMTQPITNDGSPCKLALC